MAPELYVDAAGHVDWDALGEGASMEMPMVIDNTAPTLEDVSLSLTGDSLPGYGTGQSVCSWRSFV